MLGNRIRFRFDRSDINYHGPNRATRVLTARIVRMGSYAKTWSLYLYGPKGGWLRLEVCFPRWRGPWPDSTGSEPRRTVAKDSRDV